MRVVPERSQIGPVLHVFVSEKQDLVCVDNKVSPTLHGSAWIRMSRGVAQWARQSPECAPEIE